MMSSELRVAFERLHKLSVRRREIFFQAPAISGRIMPLRSVERQQFLNQRLSLFFPSSNKGGSSTVVFNEMLRRIEIAFVELHRGFKFLASFPGERVRAEHRRVIGLPAIGLPQPIVVFGVFRIDSHGPLAALLSRIKLFDTQVGLGQEKLDLPVVGFFCRGCVEDGDSRGVIRALVSLSTGLQRGFLRPRASALAQPEKVATRPEAPYRLASFASFRFDDAMFTTLTLMPSCNSTSPGIATTSPSRSPLITS